MIPTICRAICGQKLLYVQQFLARCGKTFPLPNSQHWNLTHHPTSFRDDPEKTRLRSVLEKSDQVSTLWFHHWPFSDHLQLTLNYELRGGITHLPGEILWGNNWHGNILRRKSHLCLESSLERLDRLKFWSSNFVSWNLQQHLIDLATFAEEDQRRVSFTTFQQCQCRLFEVKRTAVK